MTSFKRKPHFRNSIFLKKTSIISRAPGDGEDLGLGDGGGPFGGGSGGNGGQDGDPSTFGFYDALNNIIPAAVKTNNPFLKLMPVGQLRKFQRLADHSGNPFSKNELA